MLRFLLVAMSLFVLLVQSSYLPSFAQSEAQAASGDLVGITADADLNLSEKTNTADQDNLHAAAEKKKIAVNTSNSGSNTSSGRFSTGKKIVIAGLVFCLVATAIAVPIAVGVATHHHHHTGNPVVLYYLLRTRQLQLTPQLVPRIFVPSFAPQIPT